MSRVADMESVADAESSRNATKMRRRTAGGSVAPVGALLPVATTPDEWISASCEATRESEAEEGRGWCGQSAASWRAPDPPTELSMRLDDSTFHFLLQLRADGRSPHTIGQYARHLGA